MRQAVVRMGFLCVPGGSQFVAGDPQRVRYSRVRGNDKAGIGPGRIGVCGRERAGTGACPYRRSRDAAFVKREAGWMSDSRWGKAPPCFCEKRPFPLDGRGSVWYV